MNAHEAVILHKQRFPQLADLPLEVLLMFAQEIAREEKRQEDEMKQQHCAVCFCVITDKDAEKRNASAFHVTCADHAKHATTFDLSRVRSNLGIPHWHKFPPFWKFDVVPQVPPVPETAKA
jgi:hypothetical protein